MNTVTVLSRSQMTKVQEKINPNTGQVIERTVTEPGDSNIKALQENRRKRLRL